MTTLQKITRHYVLNTKNKYVLSNLVKKHWEEFALSYGTLDRAKNKVEKQDYKIVLIMDNEPRLFLRSQNSITNDYASLSCTYFCYLYKYYCNKYKNTI